MEARTIKAGRRECVRVLRLPETFGLDDPHAAVKKAPRMSAVGFDFKAIPKLDKMRVPEPARCERIERRENVVALGPGGTGKTHAAPGSGLAACRKGLSVVFTTAAALAIGLEPCMDGPRWARAS